MSRIFNDGRLYDGDKPGWVGKRLDTRSYPKMELPADPSLSYLIGVESAMRFILSIPLRAVPLSAVEALDRVEAMQEVSFEIMEEANNVHDHTISR